MVTTDGSEVLGSGKVRSRAPLKTIAPRRGRQYLLGQAYKCGQLTASRAARNGNAERIEMVLGRMCAEEPDGRKRLVKRSREM